MQLTIPILVGIALADSINPVSFGVLMHLLKHQKASHNTDTMVKAGYEYLGSYMSTYAGFGLVSIYILTFLGSIQAHIYSILGAVIILLGLIELNRVTGSKTSVLNLGAKPEARIEAYTNEFMTGPAIGLTMGINTALRELIYSGGFYLGLIGLLSINGSINDNFTFLFLYNAVIATPLLIILHLVKNKDETKDFQLWIPGTRKTMMVGIACLQVVLGIWLLFWRFV